MAGTRGVREHIVEGAPLMVVHPLDLMVQKIPQDASRHTNFVVAALARVRVQVSSRVSGWAYQYVVVRRCGDDLELAEYLVGLDDIDLIVGTSAGAAAAQSESVETVADLHRGLRRGGGAAGAKRPGSRLRRRLEPPAPGAGRAVAGAGAAAWSGLPGAARTEECEL